VVWMTRAPHLQRRDDACFGDGDGLLLHGLQGECSGKGACGVLGKQIGLPGHATKAEA
jgi:hypothetical protein